MALTQATFKKSPVDNNVGKAKLQVLDLIGQPTSQRDGRLTWVLNDGGQVAALTITDGTVEAHPLAVGTATATATGVENGVAMTATATVTVTNVGGRLVAAWTSGSMTIT